MRPRVVAALGTDSRRFLATMARELAGWAPSRNPPPSPVFTEFGRHKTLAVALLHPSGYHGSLGRRRYGDLSGLEAEAALLRDAVAKQVAIQGEDHPNPTLEPAKLGATPRPESFEPSEPA